VEPPRTRTGTTVIMRVPCQRLEGGLTFVGHDGWARPPRAVYPSDPAAWSSWPQAQQLAVSVLIKVYELEGEGFRRLISLRHFREDLLEARHGRSCILLPCRSGWAILPNNPKQGLLVRGVRHARKARAVRAARQYGRCVFSLGYGAPLPEVRHEGDGHPLRAAFRSPTGALCGLHKSGRTRRDYRKGYRNG